MTRPSVQNATKTRVAAAVPPRYLRQVCHTAGCCYTVCDRRHTGPRAVEPQKGLRRGQEGNSMDDEARGIDPGPARAQAPSSHRRWPPSVARHSGAPDRRTYAALDLGTNNCRLLVARPTADSFRVIDAFSRIIRLGAGGAVSGLARGGASALSMRCASAATRCSTVASRARD